MPTPPSQSEIDDQMNIAAERMDAGLSEARAMTYEEGVHAALMWVTGYGSDAPLDPDGF